jgi:hypothetical protein
VNRRNFLRCAGGAACATVEEVLRNFPVRQPLLWV